jgi:peptidyl-tRNA hydrolase, PTH1 family
MPRALAYLPPVSDDGTWLIVGLGNPGPRYAGNRHNVGAMVADELVARSSTTLTTHKARAMAATIRIGTLPGGAPGPAAVVAVPSSYMNESGGPVKALMRFFSVDAQRLLVIHDELDIPAGDVRLKHGGGEGGHNGLRSITSAIGTKDYLRVRVGIGRPPGRMDAADYVLRDFSGTERKELPLLLGDAADAVEMVVTQGLVAAQQKFHSPA